MLGKFFKYKLKVEHFKFMKGVFLSLNLDNLSKLTVEIENCFKLNNTQDAKEKIKKLNQSIGELLLFLEHQGWFKD